MEQEQTCGRGLAQAAAVPAGLAAVAAGLAENLEFHLRSLGHGDSAAERERHVYERVSKNLRDAAASLQAAGEEMALAEHLPMAEHDVATLKAPEVLDIFERSVRAENGLRELLDLRRAENEQMLSDIRAESGP